LGLKADCDFFVLLVLSLASIPEQPAKERKKSSNLDLDDYIPGFFVLTIGIELEVYRF
jgi:hypothetical protein